MMRSTKPFLLNMRKELKQWCHENYHLFIEGIGKQDKLSIGCGEDVNQMFYNPLFQFGQIFQDPGIFFTIEELFDDAAGNGIYNKSIEDFDWFPIEDED